jgi:hypothetical protein
MSTVFDSLIDRLHSSIEKKAEDLAALPQKTKRPLKMPKNYDFSVRNVDWTQYKDDYVLRTDAVWEKSKLLDIFYTHYKSKFVYDNVNNKYMIANIRQMATPTNEAEHFEDWRPFYGYTDVDGCVWQFKVGPMLQKPSNLSGFVTDKEGDSWYLCFLSFQKFMMCNERSPIKIDEAHLHNKGFFDYPCYDQFDQIMDYCGGDLFEPMFEMYKVRLMSGTQKTQGYNRMQLLPDAYGSFKDRKVLHY